MKTKSFTLIELLVVIVIIGILAGVIIVSTSSSIGKANFAKAQAFSNTVQQELLLNLVSEWTFDEGNAQDSWGNNDGTLYGANGLPQLQTKENCVYGTCYLFDGVDDYIKTNSGTTLLLPNFTSAVWVKLNAGAYKGIVEMEGIGGRVARMMTFPGNTIQFHPYYASTNTNSFVETTFLIGEWIYLVGTFDGTFGKLYKNGKYIGSTTLISSLSYPTDTYLTIGRDSGLAERILNGAIDDLRIYKKALALSQIKQEYIAGLNSLLVNNSISKEEYNERINSLALHDD